MNGAGGEYSGDPFYIDGTGGRGGDFRIDIPLGLPGIPFFIPRIDIPDFRKIIEIFFPETNVPETFVGTVESPLPPHETQIVDVAETSTTDPNPGNAPMISLSTNPNTVNGVTYKTASAANVARQGKAHLLGPGNIVGQAGPVPFPSDVTNTTEDTGMIDLGNLFGDLAKTYINVKYGGEGNLVDKYGSTTYPENPPGQVGVDMGIPFVDVVPEGKKGYVWDYGANCGAGKLRKKSRRRRRRLATASDIKDIAALKATAGPAILKTWIATHPS